MFPAMLGPRSLRPYLLTALSVMACLSPAPVQAIDPYQTGNVRNDGSYVVPPVGSDYFTPALAPLQQPIYIPQPSPQVGISWEDPRPSPQLRERAIDRDGYR